MKDDPDAPEELVDFERRHIQDPGCDYYSSTYFTLDQSERNVYLRDLAHEWRKEERRKAENRKVKQNQESMRKREARDIQRKQEREAEQERRNPTPVIQPADFKVPIPYSIRDQHIYVPGGNRNGKTTLLLNLIMADIENGQGVAVLDPKGGLIHKICGLMPEDRIKDCIFLDLESTPVPLDFMGHRTNEVETTIGELVFIITNNDPNLKQAGPMLKRAIRTLLSVPGTTFLDISKFFTDTERQREILDALKLVNEDLWKSWQPMPKFADHHAITGRMDNFIWNPALQIVFGKAAAALQFDQAMDQRKIILANLAPINNADNQLYGSLLVSKFLQAILRRDPDIPEADQIPFFLYVDEFEFFQTASFATIFSVAGGLGLRLTVGNQFIDQLSSEIRSAVIGNAGTYIIFALGAIDYPLFKVVTHPYDPVWLTRLKERQAMFKVGRGATPVFKWTKNSKPFENSRAKNVLQQIKDQTLSEYGPKDDTNAESSQISAGDKPPSHPPAEMPKLGDEGPSDDGPSIEHEQPAPRPKKPRTL